MSSPTPRPDSSGAPSSQGIWRKRLLIAGAVAGVWTVLGGWWLPKWVQPRVESAASEALGTPVAIDRIRVQPWTGLVSVEGLQVGPKAAPLLHVDTVTAQLSLESLWRFAPVLRRVSLIKPELWVERQSAERFNFSPVLDKLTAEPKTPKPPSEPVHFAVFNIALDNGSVHYTDRVLSQTHEIAQLHIGVPFISNLPSKVEVEVEPSLSARVDGSPLLIKGQTLPFEEGLKSQVQVKLDAVNVPHWLVAAKPFLPEAWRPEGQSGKLDADLTVSFEARKPPEVAKLAIKGNIQLQQLKLGLKQAPVLGDAALGWESLRVSGLDLMPLVKQVDVAQLQLDGVQWHNQLPAPAPSSGAQLELDAPQIKSEPSKPSASAADDPWRWHVGQLRVVTNRLDVQPASPSAKDAKAWPALASVRIEADGLDSRREAKSARWQLAVRDEHGGSINAQGQVQAFKQEVQAQLDVNQLSLSNWLIPVMSTLKLPVDVRQGDLSLTASLQARLKTLSATEPAQAQVLSARLGLKGLDVRATRPGLSDRLGWDELALEGVQATLDLGDKAGLQSAHAETLRVTHLDGQVTRGKGGEWFGIALPASESSGKTASSTFSKLPDILLQMLQCEDCRLAMVDQTVAPSARFELTKLNLQAAGLSSDMGKPIQLSLDTLAQGSGRMQFKGDVRPQPLSLNGRVTVAGLETRAIQPYIDPYVNITLAAAKAQADGQVKLEDKGQAGLQARYKGRLGLTDLRVQDRVNDAAFLRWKTLSLDAMDVSWSPQNLDADLGRISLKDFYGRIIINPDGKLNLAGLMRQEAGAEARSLTTPEVAKAKSPATPASSASSASSAASAPTVTANTTAPKPKPKLRWQLIQLSKGRIDFTDNFIKPNYSANLTQMEGEVSAVSSTKPEPATIRVAGSVDDSAPLLITGRLHPLGPQLFTDVEGSARGIELPRLSPYASRYAGYAIEKGALSVTVHYKVDGGKLDASNQIFLDQLTFGEKTDSPDAVKLPVLLAVSLLKDRHGQIDINLPISGSLDDPQFSVGGIIWRVLVNLIGKAVTAPFALLSGGGSDELGFVDFEPGSAKLTPAATARLDALATKLQDRPALKLEATGRADPAVDVEGLRRRYVERLMRRAKAKATGADVAEISIDAAERPTWLKAAYKAADIKKPRNIIGLAKDLSNDEMEALLKADTPTDAEALRALANQRGDAVMAHLAGKLPPERTLLTASKVGGEGLPSEHAAATVVQFDVK